MAKPRVTITLGDAGRMVKMGDNIMVDRGRTSRSKRFTQDRPWNNAGSNNFIHSKKRHHGNGGQWRSGGSRVQGSRVVGNDLRYKLICKHKPHHFQGVFEEFRKRNPQKLSKYIRPSKNLCKHSHRPVPNGINNLNQIPDNGITNGLHLCSMQTVNQSKSFAMMPHIIPTAPARTDLVTSNGVFDPLKEAGIVPLTSNDEEHLTVARLLNSLGLGKYEILFRAAEVDMSALRQMGDSDFKELGIPMGPRKKLLLALVPPARRRLSSMKH